MEDVQLGAPPGVDRPGEDDAGGPDPRQLEAVEDLDALLGRVDAALARLDAGTYGRCAACGAELDEAFLERDPTAVVCTACDAPAGVPDRQ